jgi:hypothetical protein
MRGVALIFGEAGPTFGTAAVVGFEATVQNALVNLGTRQGTDPLYPERGTTLQKDASAGKLVELNSAQHASNFAASDTLFFLRDFDAVGDPDAISELKLAPANSDQKSLLLEATFLSADGRVLGLAATL